MLVKNPVVKLEIIITKIAIHIKNTAKQPLHSNSNETFCNSSRDLKIVIQIKRKMAKVIKTKHKLVMPRIVCEVDILTKQMHVEHNEFLYIHFF